MPTTPSTSNTTTTSRLGRLARVGLAAGILSALPVAALVQPAQAGGLGTTSGVAARAAIGPDATIPPIIVTPTTQPDDLPPDPGPEDPGPDDCIVLSCDDLPIANPEPDPCVQLDSCPTPTDPGDPGSPDEPGGTDEPTPHDPGDPKADPDPGRTDPTATPTDVIDPPVVAQPTFTG